MLGLLGRSLRALGFILFILGTLLCGMAAEAEERKMQKAAKFSPVIVFVTASLLLLFSCFACAPPQPSGYLVYGIRPVQPTQSLREAYEFLANCTGEEGDFDSIAWFRADSIRSKDGDDGYYGLHVRHPVNRMRSIILANPSSAFHEIMHDLGVDHEDEIFDECLASYYLFQLRARSR